jgi:Transcriptional regulator/sugar kinase
MNRIANLVDLNQESKNIFNLIYKKGPLTKNAIMDAANLKLTKLNRLMTPLEKAKLIHESSIGDSTGGRKPILYDVNQRDYFVIGIDLSRTYTKIVITNLKMDVLNSRQFPMDDASSPEKTVAMIYHSVENMLQEMNIGYEMFLGIGLGTVGPLDRGRGIILNPPNFPAFGWNNVPIKELIEQVIHLPVFVDNGANTAVLVEHFFGEGKNFMNMAYINCGIGIRNGAIANGKIIRTLNNAEDVFGHMIIDVDGERCNCGNFGCIECYSSIFAIVANYIAALKKGRTSIIAKPIDKITYMDICSAADEGDELAKEIITSAATIFGAGLANYINLLNPGLVILSGPLINHSDLFYCVSKTVALKKHYSQIKPDIFFHKGGHFGDNAIAIGAAAMALENYLG